jgi:hypothetical protein
MENINGLHSCQICNKKYKTYKSLWNHNKKFHNDITIKTSEIISKNSDNVLKNSDITSKNYNCRTCSRVFNNIKTRWSHEQKCKTIESKNKNLEEKKLDLALKKEEARILQLKIELNYIDNDILEQPINNQLINIIVDKNKTIEELTTKINYNVNNESIIDNKILGKPLIEFHKLILNDVIIVSRTEDNYINATQLCQAGGKKFNHWYSLESTKLLINEATSEAVITASGTDSLIEINKGGNDKNNQITWVHPDLAIQLAQWISPKFALQVSKWIRTLLTNGQIELLKNKDNQLKNKDDELKLKNQKIQLLEDTYIKQQKRKSYPTKNVIYMLTTEDHKKNRLYIIGKACNLKNRLGNYNKTAEHEVVYYKNCESEKDMTAIETLVLKKLNKYREKANRDRFILPLENDISLFTNVINECINFFI